MVKLEGFLLSLFSLIGAGIAILSLPYFEHGFRQGIPFLTRGCATGDGSSHLAGAVFREMSNFAFRLGLIEYHKKFVLAITNSRGKPLLEGAPVSAQYLSVSGTNVSVFVPQRSSADEALPVVEYIHGGGFAVGSPDYVDRSLRILAQRLRAVVVAPDYRKAPVHVYPAALNDCTAVMDWILQDKDSRSVLGAVDLKKVIVAGDSAGGNLAASVSYALKLRSSKESKPHPVALQVLVYPSVKFVDADVTESQKKYAKHGLFVNYELMQHFTNAYTKGMTPEQIKADWSISPLTALKPEDYKGMPQTLLVTAEHDVLRDEGIQYGQKLKAQGVPVTFVNYANKSHSFAHNHFCGTMDVELLEEISKAAKKL